ncbi:MAG: hypothetical protein WC977_14250, partial [Anaerovoracaceae bacterium]
MSKIARIKDGGETLIKGEIIEGDNISLKNNGDLHVGELIEGDKFSIVNNGIEVTEIIEDCSFDDEEFIDVYGFGRLVLLPDGALNE